jgi:hypothetical protein
MANKKLLISSLICGIIHILYCSNIYLFGIIISILNHAYTNEKIKIIDRISMIVYFICDLIIQSNYLLLLSVIFYFIAKITKNDLFHVAAHFALTFAHISIISNSSLT